MRAVCKKFMQVCTLTANSPARPLLAAAPARRALWLAVG